MCLCSAFTVKPGSLPSQVKWIFAVARVISSLMAPVKNHVLRAPEELHPIVYLGVLDPGRRLMDGGGNTTGCFANQSDLRSRSKSCCGVLGLVIFKNQQPLHLNVDALDEYFKLLVQLSQSRPPLPKSS
jgi:hypothetical protein